MSRVDYTVKVRLKVPTTMKVNGRIYTSIIEASNALGVPRASFTREYKRFLKSKRKKFEVTVNKIVEVDLLFEELSHES